MVLGGMRALLTHRRSGRAVQAAASRALGTNARPEATSHEQLKKEFRVWLRKEAQVLSTLLVVGTIGVYVYQVCVYA